MPDPTPEQPPSWPPASEPTAKPTDPPRITARGVGHLPSATPEDDYAGGTDAQQPVVPAPGDYGDLDPGVPDAFPSEPATPEVPRQQEWGAAPDMRGEWPPRENQDWISQHAQPGGWGAAQGAAWPDPAVAEVPERTNDQSYLPDPGNAPPFEADPYQAQGFPDANFRPDPYQVDERQPAASQAVPQQAEAYGPGAFQTETRPPDAYGETAAPPVEAPPAAPEPSRSSTRVAPPTHQGVRYAIYGIGGVITLGLIIAIVVMLGGPPANEPSEEGADPTGQAEPDTTEGLSAERYTELAGAVGTAEWFSWRYGEAGENAASEEVPQVGGDAAASAPLLGEADRSVQGQLAYVTGDTELSGVDHVTAVETTDGLIGVDPRAGGRFSEDGPELELTAGSTADCIAGLDTDLGVPVALARPEQSAEVNAHAVVAFSSGILATTGISTAQGGTCLQLPDGHVPTDVALTDGNELALVTTWQPETQTGSLVVVALSDQDGKYQSSWSEPYAGLPNPGAFGAAETVGVVELPVNAPTSVDAWSNSSGSLSLGRTTIDGGAHADTVATSGYALVGSLDESQAVMVDLTSTLAGLAARHYEGSEFTFDAAAGEAVDFDGGVADVAAAGDALAVATGDGVVHELDRDLGETSATDVGANPSCLEVGAQSGDFIATSRGESAVRWVRGGEVVNELTDTRLTGAMCASETPALDVSDYQGSATVLLVTDFDGSALHAYLVGSATLPSGAEVGDGAFGYGGSYEVAGQPFASSVTLDLD